MKKVKLYRCDPDKNAECKKSNCYRRYGFEFCYRTSNKKCKMNIFKRIKEAIWKKKRKKININILILQKLL